MITAWFLGQVTSPPASGVFSYMALWESHFQPFMEGRINTEGLVYYLSVCVGFLLLATRSLQARRWR